MKIFVLAAGFATRMHPLTLHQAKPLIEVGGKPLLTRIMDKVLGLEGVTDVTIIGNERFAEQFERWADDYSSPVALRVLNDGSTDDSNKLGAIGDLAFALEKVALGGSDWMVVAGDNLIEFDLTACQRAFRDRKRPMILVREIENRSAQMRYNEVTLDEDGTVRSFREKPSDPKTNLAAIGLYFFTPDVADRVALYLDQGGNPDAPGYFIEWLVGQTSVAAQVFEGEWFDIGNLETLEQARARYI